MYNYFLHEKLEKEKKERDIKEEKMKKDEIKRKSKLELFIQNIKKK